MKRVNYRELEECLIERREYQHDSSHAELDEDGITYSVYSYSTLMLRHNGRVVIYYNDKYYSRTTSRLQSKLKRVFNLIGPVDREQEYLKETRKAYDWIEKSEDQVLQTEKGDHHSKLVHQLR